jgi:hypothetical protein
VSVNQVAGPQCFVEIYPFEGGSYALTGGAILQCRVERNIRADKGRFSIALAPGGPKGTNAGPEWTRILTPLSLVLIGLTRGIYREVVMVGVVTCAKSRTVFIPEHGARRAIVVSGEDFGFFFNKFAYWSLSFLGGTAAAAGAVGQQQFGAEAGMPAVLSSGMLQGTPDQIAKNWYNEIMAGQSGILAQTQVKYGGQSVSFTDAMATLFEPYPGYTIPSGVYYIASEGSWTQKFRSILPFPWYEFFVITAPQGFYGGSAGGAGFTMKSIGASSIVSPTLVARINPVPKLKATVNGQHIEITGVDSTAWNSLARFTYDCGFIEAEIDFSADEVTNFYMLNPRYMRSTYGHSNVDPRPAMWSICGGLYDAPSIHRYGFAPLSIDTDWFADLTGDFAAGPNAATVPDAYAQLVADMASQYHPLPLMARGFVRYPLRPDVIPGSVFSFSPLKSGDAPGLPADLWDFYIDGVEHDFVFGGQCTTTLTLARGLPSAIYSDAALLQAVLSGQAERLDGIYQASANQGLQPFNIDNANSVMSNIAAVFTEAQAH